MFDAVMEMDYNKKWEVNPFLKSLRKLYIYYLKKQYFLNYAGKLWKEVYVLHNDVKEILNQHRIF